jgi:hypothetical protein
MKKHIYPEISRVEQYPQRIGSKLFPVLIVELDWSPKKLQKKWYNNWSVCSGPPRI